MIGTLLVTLATLSPILVVVALLELAAWRARQHHTAVARQITLTDAIAAELGAVVAPVVRKPVWGPWQIRIAVPFGRPSTVGTLLSIVHRVVSFGERTSPGHYEIVLTPQEEPAPAPVPVALSRARARAA